MRLLTKIAVVLLAVVVLGGFGASPAMASSHSSKHKAGYIDPRCKTKGIVLCASKIDHKLRYMKYGKVIKTLDARFGRRGHATREGTFHVFRKVRKDWSYVYHVPMGYSLYFSRGQAVHYSSDFAKHGYRSGSHGCVNTRDRKAMAWVFDHTPRGTKVVVYH